MNKIVDPIKGALGSLFRDTIGPAVMPIVKRVPFLERTGKGNFYYNI